MKKFLILLFAFFSLTQISYSTKPALILVIEEMSDSCQWGKRIGLYTDDGFEGMGYNHYRIMDCDNSFVDFNCIDSSAAKLKTGMEAHLKSGDLYDTTFVIDIYSNVQEKYLVTSHYDKDRQAVIFLDYKNVSIAASAEIQSFNYTIHDNLLNIFNQSGSYIQDISLYDITGNRLLCTYINSNNYSHQINIATLPQYIFVKIQTDKNYDILKVLNQ